MLTAVFVVLGLIVGAIADGMSGAFIGILFGLLVGTLRTTRRKIRDLDTEVTTLKDRLAMFGTATAAPSDEPSATQAQKPPAVAKTPEPEAPPAAPTTPATTSTATPADAVPKTASPAAGPGVTPPKRPPPPAIPKGPTVFDSFAEGIARVRSYLLGVNTVVQVGVLVLLVGIGLIGKWAVDNDLFPIELRLAGAALIGIGLVVVGWRLRTKRKGYAVSLQGGGVGSIYLVIFFAFRTYELIDAKLAFGVLVLLTLFSGIMAVLQDAKALAVLGAVGGFFAPIVASTGSGNHVALFSYYALLNGGIVSIAWFRAWRELNLVGFTFTFAIGGMWGAGRYEHELYASTQPFLILFVLMFTIIPVLYAWRQAPKLKGFIDGTLVFGTPILAFAYQARLVADFEFGLAYSSLGLAALYVVLATVLFRLAPEWTRALVEAFVALGLGFATMAIPFALDAQWTALGWSLEGIGLVWVGLRQNRRLPRWSGMALQLGAAIAVAVQDSVGPEEMAVLNANFFAAFSVAVAGFSISYLMHIYREYLRVGEWVLSYLFFAWASLWWFGTGEQEIDRYVTSNFELASSLGLFAGTALLADLLLRWRKWGTMRVLAYTLTPVALLHLFASAEIFEHPLVKGGWVAWPLAVAVSLWVLRPVDPKPNRVLEQMWHGAGVWLVAGLVAWELSWQADDVLLGSSAWPLVVQIAVVLLILGACTRGLPRWPTKSNHEGYLVFGGAPLAAFAAVWVLFANVVGPGDPWPIPYVPLLNPVDVAQGFVFLALVAWFTAVWRAGLSYVVSPMRVLFIVGMAALVFFGLNGTLLRAIHHIIDVRYTFDGLWRSVVVQASLSIFWTIIALCSMIYASRSSRRVVWIVAASLLGVVVAKLFTVDLSALSTGARIVSFVGVGLLMLLVGYVSPVPPKKHEPHETTDGRRETVPAEEPESTRRAET